MADEKKEQSGNGKTILIQYYRSFIAAPKTHKQIVRSLGLTKLNQIIERPDRRSGRQSWIMPAFTRFRRGEDGG